jgi:hypothetical protein
MFLRNSATVPESLTETWATRLASGTMVPDTPRRLAMVAGLDLRKLDLLIVHRNDRRLGHGTGRLGFTLRDSRWRDDSDRALQPRRQPRCEGHNGSPGRESTNDDGRATCHRFTRSPPHERPRPGARLLEIFRYGLEFVDDGLGRSAGSVRGGIQAMIDMVVNQRSLGFTDGLLDGMQLLGKIETRSPFTEHFDHPAEMTVGPLQPLHDVGMGFVNMIMCHEQ